MVWYSEKDNLRKGITFLVRVSKEWNLFSFIKGLEES